MENIFLFFTNLTGERLIEVFFKLFAVLFAFIFLIYSIVVFRQSKIMNQTFTTKNAYLIRAISFFQLLLSILLLIVAIFLI
jgi:hypothetical protein